MIQLHTFKTLDEMNSFLKKEKINPSNNSFPVSVNYSESQREFFLYLYVNIEEEENLPFTKE